MRTHAAEYHNSRIPVQNGCKDLKRLDFRVNLPRRQFVSNGPNGAGYLYVLRWQASRPENTLTSLADNGYKKTIFKEW